MRYLESRFGDTWTNVLSLFKSPLQPDYNSELNFRIYELDTTIKVLKPLSTLRTSDLVWSISYRLSPNTRFIEKSTEEKDKAINIELFTEVAKTYLQDEYPMRDEAAHFFGECSALIWSGKSLKPIAEKKGISWKECLDRFEYMTNLIISLKAMPQA